jgi:hypothetical protein
MPNQITNPPNNYDFGLNFNYAVWSPGTVLSLVNVPWNNDYRDIVRFANKTALNTYIDGLESSGSRIEKLSYVKPNTPVRISMPINRAMGFNYLRATNPLQPIPGGDVAKSYYYFITDVRYLSPNTTELILQLDVWQTFGYDVVFGTAFVERGHIGIANENQFDNYGRDYLAIPEGFDLGGEYRVIAKRSDDLMGFIENNGAYSTDTDVLVVSTVDLTADAGTADAPKLTSATGGFIEMGITGADVYIGDHLSFLTFIDQTKEKPWVTQGIISVTLMPKITRYVPNFDYGNGLIKLGGFMVRPKKQNFFANWRNSSEIINAIPERYRSLKKFFTFPYMGIELTCFTGNTTILKPEAWNDPNALIMERITYTPPNQRIDFTPRKYNSDGRKPENLANTPDDIAALLGWEESGDDFGDYLDVTIGITNLPRIPIVNNGQLSYLASNASTINYQRASAGWSEQKSLRAASTGYDQASKGLETAQALNQIAVNADIAQTGNVNRTQVAQTVTSVSANAAGSIARGAIGGAAVGGGGGALAGAGVSALGAGIDAAGNLINVGIQTAANDEALAIRNAAAASNLASQQGQGTFIRDTNKSLADWAAKGDYANEIAGINARVQDAAMIQPTVSGQFGGETINMANATVEVSLRWKLIDNATIRRIGEFWLRYGYAINTALRNLPADMMVMSHFTYWKMTETYLISAPMPESFKQAIRGIFEKGVTVWRNPSHIGTVDYALNQPIEGISY